MGWKTPEYKKTFGIASLDGNEVYLDTLGRVFDIPPKGSLKSFYHGVFNGNKFAVFSPKFEQITPYEYDDVKQIHSNVIEVRKGESWGAIDIQAKIVIQEMVEQGRCRVECIIIWMIQEKKFSRKKNLSV